MLATLHTVVVGELSVLLERLTSAKTCFVNFIWKMCVFTSNKMCHVPLENGVDFLW